MLPGVTYEGNMEKMEVDRYASGKVLGPLGQCGTALKRLWRCILMLSRVTCDDCRFPIGLRRAWGRLLRRV